MNVKRKNGKTSNKTGLIRNTLLGKIANVRHALSTNSNGSDSIDPCIFDENTRKSVKADLIWYNIFYAGQRFQMMI